VTEPGGPRRRGRHSSSDGPFNTGFDAPGVDVPASGTPHYEPARYDPPTWRAALPRTPSDTAGLRRPSGLLDRHADATGPLPEPERWSYGASDDPDHPMVSRHGRDDRPGHDGWGQNPWETGHPADEPRAQRHPSAPLPPLPTGAWDRLRPRQLHDGDDASTVAQPFLPSAPLDRSNDDEDAAGAVSGPASGDEETGAPRFDPDAWQDQTGGLEVIGAHVEEAAPRARLGRRARREAAEAAEALRVQKAADRHHDDDLGSHAAEPNESDHDALVHDEEFGEDIPVKPYDPRSGRVRRRRRPFAVLLSLLVLAGVVVGIVIGGQQLLTMLDPSSRDYAGQGTGSVDIRVREGDTLSDIARTLVDAGVVASVGPFVDAAEANAASVGIQPGVYAMRQEMSGQAALDLMLDPVARLLSRVTLPEGLTVQRTLAKLAEETGRPVEEFQAAAADPAALGLPPYANGVLEGFLFPATYDVEPDDAPVDILRGMVQQFNEVAARLQLEQRAAAAGRTPAEVVTVASMIQSETRLAEERPDVGQVMYNRLDQGIALGIDATLAFGLGKNGNELTVTDLRTDGPYNTRTRAGLPPTPISSPGEASLEAALAPTSGDLLYYVLENAEGRHFFTNDYAEFQAARQRCADAGLGCGG
jgi:uncharacterized YceG family protein